MAMIGVGLFHILMASSPFVLAFCVIIFICMICNSMSNNK
jgi:hypothetical protein